MEVQRMSSAGEIYKIFSKRGCSEEEAGVITAALDKRDNLATRDDLNRLEIRSEEGDFAPQRRVGGQNAPDRHKDGRLRNRHPCRHSHY